MRREVIDFIRSRCPKVNWFLFLTRQGISCLDFDNKGYYLASVTKSGCLTIHDFETLYCQSNQPCSKEIEAKNVMHLSSPEQLDVVRWNVACQNEVVCASLKSNEISLFDIGYISSEPVEILRARQSVNVRGSNVHKGFSDIAFTSTAATRLFASDTHGTVNIWDRRVSVFPYVELTTGSHDSLNSLQLNIENQTIFGAGKHGMIYMWDIRGGRTETGAFQRPGEVQNLPLTSFKVTAMLDKIETLKAQSDIVTKEVHSIDLDPSCPYQLAFHLDDGWSGVLDLYNHCVTHIHCPPPAWLMGADLSSNLFYLRKPSWLPTYSIYAVPSVPENGIHILDFFPDVSSPSHVDYFEDMRKSSKVSSRTRRNRSIPLSEGVTACATHPANGTIIAGTELASLLLISQKHERLSGE
ncbi:uncharacterized protein LOC115734542 isoform X2 [Rhodamnia argentea]|uniref:Uncharacterized protein LOC115734542 isoform X2 n=1 Tax=Rhodamnia argentea TaxID=178133 RepID=A0A8B8NFK5_9MYRT|nr:uncharacterized protein LOC115734542 isoform X2 [Rhodamnia argentea]XP_048137433.1 uncharacterized protein LOC115734542 isoform X2 [Rhodamnia argentea]